METYQEMRARQQREVNALPLGFAFNEQQFQEMMRKLGVSSPDELYRLGSTGGFHRRSDTALIVGTFQRHIREWQEAVHTPDGINISWLEEMIYEEMCNHEYGINCDGRHDVLNACDITEKEMEHPDFQTAWANARKRYFRNAEEKHWF